MRTNTWGLEVLDSGASKYVRSQGALKKIVRLSRPKTTPLVFSLAIVNGLVLGSLIRVNRTTSTTQNIPFPHPASEFLR